MLDFWKTVAFLATGQGIVFEQPKPISQGEKEKLMEIVRLIAKLKPETKEELLIFLLSS